METKQEKKQEQVLINLDMLKAILKDSNIKYEIKDKIIRIFHRFYGNDFKIIK